MASPTPKKPLGDHDVVVVLDRLKSARDPKDRGGAVRQLQALGKEDAGRVSRLAVPLAVDMLRARRLGQLDEGTAQAILELLEGLLRAPGTGREAALQALVADATSLDALLDMVEGSDTLTTVGALQVVQAALEAGPGEVEAALQGGGGSQQGMVRLVACLSDEREEVRNEVLLVLGKLTATSSSANLKTLVAFNEGFERLLAMVEDDGGLLEGGGGGVITQDCLRLLGNVVEGTPSAQRQFVELGPLDSMAPWFDVARLVPSASEEEGEQQGKGGEEDGLPRLDAQQTAAFHLALRVLRNLAAGPGDDEGHHHAGDKAVSPLDARAAADRRQRQLRIVQCRQGALLASLVQMATCPWRGAAVAREVQAEALRVLALLAEGNAPAQDALLGLRLDPLSFAWAVDDSCCISEADRTHGSAALPAALLRLALRGRHGAVRAGARLLLHRLLDGNEMACVLTVQHVIAPPLAPVDDFAEAGAWTPLPVPFGVVLLEETVAAVSLALAGGRSTTAGGVTAPAEVIEAAQAACFFLEHVLAQGGLAAKELATRLPAALGGESQQPPQQQRQLLDWVALLVQQCLDAAGPALEPVSVALLRLLAVWTSGCPAAARALLPAHLFLFDVLSPPTTTTDNVRRKSAHVRALAALVVGVCLEHWGDSDNGTDGGVPAVVEQHCSGGLGGFAAALESLERVLVPGKNFVGAWPAPEAVDETAPRTWPYYDSRFVDLYRCEAKAIRRRLLLASSSGGSMGVEPAAGVVEGEKGAARYLEVIAEQEKEIDFLKLRIERILATMQEEAAEAALQDGGVESSRRPSLSPSSLQQLGPSNGGVDLFPSSSSSAAAFPPPPPPPPPKKGEQPPTHTAALEAALGERDARLSALQAEVQELRQRLAVAPPPPPPPPPVPAGVAEEEEQARLAGLEAALAGKEDEVRKLRLELQKAEARERRAAEEGAVADKGRVAVEGELEAVNVGYQALQQQLEQAHRAAHDEAQRRKRAEEEVERLKKAQVQQQPIPSSDAATALRAEVEALRAQAAQLPEYRQSLEEYQAYAGTLAAQLEEMTRYSAEQEGYAAGLQGQVAALAVRVQQLQQDGGAVQAATPLPAESTGAGAVAEEAVLQRMQAELQQAQQAEQKATDALQVKEAEAAELRRELAALQAAEGSLPTAASLFPLSPPRGPGQPPQGEGGTASLFPPSAPDAPSFSFPPAPPPQEEDGGGEEKRRLRERVAALEGELAEATARYTALEQEAKQLRAEVEAGQAVKDALGQSEANSERLGGEVEQLTARVRELEAAVASTGAKVAELVEERDAAVARAAEAEGRARSVAAALEEREGQRAVEAEGALDEAKARVAVLEEEVGALRGRLAEEEGRFALVQAELAAALQTGEDSVAQVEELKGAVAAAKGEEEALKTRLAEQEEEVRGLRAQLSEVVQAREEALARVSGLEEAARAAVQEEAAGRVKGLEGELARVRAALEAAQGQVRALEEQAAQAAAASAASAEEAAAVAAAEQEEEDQGREGAVTPSQPTREELLRALAEKESEAREMEEDREILTREFQGLVQEAQGDVAAAEAAKEEALLQLATTEAKLQQHVESLHAAWSELEAAQAGAEAAVKEKEAEVLAREESLALLRARYEALATRRMEMAELLEEREGLEGEVHRLRAYVGELEGQLQQASAGWKGLVEEREAELKALREAERHRQHGEEEEMGQQAHGTVDAVGEPSTDAPVAPGAAPAAAEGEVVASLRARVADLEGQLQGLRQELGRQQREQAAVDGEQARVEAEELRRLQGEVERQAALLAEREAEAGRLVAAQEELRAVRVHVEGLQRDVAAERAVGQRKDGEGRRWEAEVGALLSSLEVRLGAVPVPVEGGDGGPVQRLRWYVEALSARVGEAEAAVAGKERDVGVLEGEVRELRRRVEEGMRGEAEAGGRVRALEGEKARVEQGLHAELDELRVAMARQAEELQRGREQRQEQQEGEGSGSGRSGSLVLEGVRMELQSLRGDYEALKRQHAAAAEEARGKLERATALLEAKEAAMAAAAREHNRLRNELDFELRLRGGMLADRDQSLEVLGRKLAEQRRAGQQQGEAWQARALAAEEECEVLRARVEDLSQRLSRAAAAAAAAREEAAAAGKALRDGDSGGGGGKAAALQARLRERDEALAKAQDQALTLRQERDRLRREVEEGRAAAAEAQRRVRGELTAALQQNAEMQLELNGRVMEHNALRGDLLALKAEAAKHEGLAALQREAEARLRDKERRVAALEGQVQTLAAQRDHLRDKLEETWHRIAAGTLELPPLHPSAPPPAAAGVMGASGNGDVGVGAGRPGSSSSRMVVIPGEEEGPSRSSSRMRRGGWRPTSSGAGAGGRVGSSAASPTTSCSLPEMALEDDLLDLRSKLSRLQRDLGEERMLHRRLESEHEEVLEVLATHDLASSDGGGGLFGEEHMAAEQEQWWQQHHQQQPFAAPAAGYHAQHAGLEEHV